MMTNHDVLLLLLNLACAFGLTFLLYKNLLKDKTQRVLALFRFLSFFLLGILLINPKIDATEYSVEKPKLVFAVDNSESIQNISKPSEVNRFVSEVNTDKELNESYSVNFISFGSSLKTLEDSLSFSETNTDISKVIDYANALEGSNSTLVLISDGNQTLGQDYKLKSFKDDLKAKALVLGETTVSIDSKIDLVNLNNYAYFKNKFPVEVFVSQNSSKASRQKLSIYQDEVLKTSKTLDILPESSVKTKFLLTAAPVGTNTITIKLEPLTEEKNTSNNEKTVSLDVIDSRSKLLLVSDMLHPDIGFFNRILESSKELEFVYKSTDDEINPADYDLIIFYQPLYSFSSLISSTLEKNINHLIIGGTQTDYSFLNELDLGFQKQLINSTEEYTALVNPGFSFFKIDDLIFNDLPPVEDQFGDVDLNRNYSVLLDKRLNGLDVELPLWFFNSKDNVKQSLLFGENIWKWRARHYVENSSFTKFDNTFKKILQYLSQSKFKNQLLVEVEPVINSGDNKLLKATYYNSNFETDTRFDFNILLKNLGTEEVQELRLIKGDQYYSLDLSKFEPGDYSYTLESPKIDIKKSGQFKILDYSAEMQFENSNFTDLQKLVKADDIYLFSEKSELISELKTTKPKPVQKSTKKTQSLINFEWLILLLALTLSIEWFYRKYKGLI